MVIHVPMYVGAKLDIGYYHNRNGNCEMYLNGNASQTFQAHALCEYSHIRCIICYCHKCVILIEIFIYAISNWRFCLYQYLCVVVTNWHGVSAIGLLYNVLIDGHLDDSSTF